MSDWYRDGVAVDSVSLDDRGVQYGDGVFETVAVRDGRTRLWDLHMKRLRHACTRLAISMPAEGILAHDVERALARTTVNTSIATLKIIVSAGSGPRGYRRPKNGRCNTLVGVFDAESLPRSYYIDGVRTMLCKTRVSEQPMLGGIKILNRLDQVLASAEFEPEQFFEGLMRDAEDHLVCGTRCNVFVVRDNRIRTPSLERSGVAGIMRRLIIDLLGDNGIDCEKADIRVSELASADEIFLSNSQFGVVPVRACAGTTWAVGEATRSVMTMLSYEKVTECRP